LPQVNINSLINNKNILFLNYFHGKAHKKVLLNNLIVAELGKGNFLD